MSHSRRTFRLLQLESGALLLALAASGCDSHSTADAEAAVDPARELRLIVSGDTHGWIVPCGCASNQSGGLLRRGTFMKQQPAEADLVYVDVGGAPGGAARYEQVKFEAILQGELALELAAHNIGGPEIALGPDVLRDLAFRLKVPFVSANVTDAAGQPVAEPFRIVEAGGRRLLITGVLSPDDATEEVRIRNPRDAVLGLLDEIETEFDALIVLAYLPEVELRELASELPEADVIVGGPTGQSIPPVRVGPTLLASATNKGKFVAELIAPAEAGRNWTGRVVEMTEDFADDPAQVANVDRFRDRLAELDLPAVESGFGPRLPDPVPAGYAIAGSDSCRDCHAGDHALWQDSPHAHAWETLQPDRAFVDSYCQQCHTTGFGLPGGFTSIGSSPHRVDVGCESCHGPSQAHVDDPAVRTTYPAAGQCITCHDPENSPQFDFDHYWEQIIHGEDEQQH